MEEQDLHNLSTLLDEFERANNIDAEDESKITITDIKYNIELMLEHYDRKRRFMEETYQEKLDFIKKMCMVLDVEEFKPLTNKDANEFIDKHKGECIKRISYFCVTLHNIFEKRMVTVKMKDSEKEK